MLKDTISYCGGNSFLQRQIHKLKVNGLMKKCEDLKEHIKKIGELGKDDRKVNIIIPDESVIKGKSIYIMIKGYNKDGSFKPLKKYTLVNNVPVEESKDIRSEVIVLDLYEKSIYLYNPLKDDRYITGYILKEENVSSSTLNLVFTKEKVRVLLKNTNAIYEYSSVDTFVEKYYM
jgi:hypothetical protein